MPNLLLIIGLVLFALACRTFDHRWFQRVGRLSILAATFLAGYFLLGHWAYGLIAASLWLLFPWVEILTQVRNLEFPLNYPIKSKYPPNQEVFPDLDVICEEIEGAAFEPVDDVGWVCNDAEHFVRLFHHEPNRTLTALCISQENDFVMAHVSVSTRTHDGRVFETTNYPYSTTMRKLPSHHLRRITDADSFVDILEAHTRLMRKHRVELEDCVPQDPDQVRSQLIRELRAQIDHNLSLGLIVKTEDDKNFRYSFRGCFYLWIQVLKDLIRN